MTKVELPPDARVLVGIDVGKNRQDTLKAVPPIPRARTREALHDTCDKTDPTAAQP